MRQRDTPTYMTQIHTRAYEPEAETRTLRMRRRALPVKPKQSVISTFTEFLRP